MDPPTAFSLAAAAFQCVAYAITVCLEFKEISQSTAGFSEDVEGQQNRVLSFQQSCTAYSLEAKRYRDGLALPLRNSNDCTAQSPLENTIQRCQKVGKKLRQRLSSLEAKSKDPIHIFATAVKSIWERKGLKELNDQLTELRGDLVCHTMPLLVSISDHQVNGFNEMTALQNRILEVIDPSEPPSSRSPSTRDFGNELAGQVQLVKRFIENLRFPGMEDREMEISPPQKGSFRWVFNKHAKVAESQWDDFGSWVDSEKPIYWVNGKAGSGKSTLIKYLSWHNYTMKKLDIWGKGTQVIVARYYFWKSGGPLQRSLEGFLRSLLYDILSNSQQLAAMALGKELRPGGFDENQFWTPNRLQNVWTGLTNQTEVPLRLCLFVDGLDECDNVNDSRYRNIISLLKATGSKNIKICISSRPDNAFEDAFGKGPKLSLQHHTEEDIKIYIQHRLLKNDRMIAMERCAPGFPKEMATRIQQRASGVFLWVKLVVESLLDGLQDADRPVDLIKRVEKLPKELEELFRHILDNINSPEHREEGIRLLSLVKYAQSYGGLTLRQFFLMDEVLVAANNYLGFIPADELPASCTNMEEGCHEMVRRIKSRCKGLLEVPGFDEKVCSECFGLPVLFLHKTVADFVREDPVDLYNHKRLPFSPAETLMRMILLDLRIRGSCKSREEWFMDIWPLIDKFLLLAQAEECRTQKPNLDLVNGLRDTVDGIWQHAEWRWDEERNGLIHWSKATEKRLKTKWVPYRFSSSGMKTIRVLKLPSSDEMFTTFAEGGLKLYTTESRIEESAGSKSDEENAGSERDEENAGSERDEENAGSERDEENAGSERDEGNAGSERDEENAGSERDEETAGSESDEENAGSERDEENAGSERDEENAGSESDEENAGSESDEENAGSESDEENAGSESDEENAGSEKGNAESESGEENRAREYSPAEWPFSGLIRWFIS